MGWLSRIQKPFNEWYVITFWWRKQQKMMILNLEFQNYFQIFEELKHVSNTLYQNLIQFY